jgi:glutamate-1-semialdehyde 2,1-aminomutase
MKKKVTAIVQARVGSSRLRGKVLKKINGKEIIILLLDRLSKSKKIENIIVAIPQKKEDDLLFKVLKKNNYNVFRGDELDVLKRYYDCAKKNNIHNILRITGDCPLVDPTLVDNLINVYQKKKVDYLSNIEERSYPDGMDIEIFSMKALSQANSSVVLFSDKEHVTNYFLRSDIFKKYNYLKNGKNFSNLRITLDTKNDFKLIKIIFKNFKNKFFKFDDIIKFYRKNKNLFHQNINFHDKEKLAKMITGQKIWNRAKKSISGGNMLFSKRPDVFLPDYWPSYFKEAKGCLVTDLDNKKYYDVSIMGIGTNILGYANNQVDKAVISRIKKSNMSTLNCVEEVYLAEKLINLHPWANQVRFARTGGEANSISIRIARAYSKKSKIAFCGYHGWHDWYLATNLKTKNNLNGHLLPGLQTAGVPKNLSGTIFPFKYNDFEELKKLLNKNPDIGIIKMEVVRNEMPKNNFLKKVRKIANERNIVLIFDECTSGFRQCFGGIHKIFGIEPDILMLGKALGNGYAITAVLGREKIMNSIKKTFISSTFWTESSGPTAALKTLEIMEKTKSWKKITKTGQFVKLEWKKLALKYNLKIKINGIPALSSFVFQSNNHQAYKTFITQEMLKKGFLATTTIYISVSHTRKILDKYFFHLEKIFKIISKCEKGDDIYKYIETKNSTTDFARLN